MVIPWSSDFPSTDDWRFLARQRRDDWRHFDQKRPVERVMKRMLLAEFLTAIGRFQHGTMFGLVLVSLSSNNRFTVITNWIEIGHVSRGEPTSSQFT